MEENAIRLQKSRRHKRISPNGLRVQFVGRGKGEKAQLLGNPFKVGEKVPQWYLDMAAEMPDYEYSNIFFEEGNINNTKECVLIFDDYMWLLFVLQPEKYAQIMELCKEKNLECWCKLSEPCHADILLKRCNEYFNLY